MLDSSSSGERYSLSFRKRIPPYQLVVNPPKPGTPTLPPSPRMARLTQNLATPTNSQTTSGSNHSQTASVPIPGNGSCDNIMLSRGSEKPQRKRTTVLFGTSITTRIPNDLAEKGRNFVNISQSGARIADIDNLIDNFIDRHPKAHDVEKVILSFGTNDIKYDSSRSGANKLRVPIGHLIAKVKHVFPGAVVLIQSVLPMRNLYWYTCRNVITLNMLFRELSRNYNCVFVNCVRDFLSPDHKDHNRRLFNDHFHLNFFGRKVLSHWLHCLVNSSSFDRVVC